MCFLVFSMSKSNIKEIRSDAQGRFSRVKLVTSEPVLSIHNARTIFKIQLRIQQWKYAQHILVNKMLKVKKK